MTEPLRSRSNPRVQRWRALVREAGARRREGRMVLEGPHLVAAALEAGLVPHALLLSDRGAARPELVALAGAAAVRLSDAAFAAIADAGSPAGLAGEFDIPGLEANAPGTVFLDAIQDAGNVGAILRSAAAFGVGRVVLGRGCADAWSPKVLRAGMGAHFRLALESDADLAQALARHAGPVACMVPRGGTALDRAELGPEVAWLLGAEGQGVDPALQALVPLKVTIPMATGTESLNVAAAAAVCFYAAFSRRAA